MARKTKQHNITNEEKLTRVCQENTELLTDYLGYLQSIDRAPTTIKQYRNALEIFFVYNLENNGNKRFTEITKRDFARFQNFALNVWEWSPKRIRMVKSVISSLSNYIENILDEEEAYKGYRSIINKIESPVNVTVREKSIFTEPELKSLLDYLVSRREYRKAAVLALAMYSGRRKSELPRFKADYFTDNNVIFGTLWKTPERIRTKGRGAKGKQIYCYVLKREFEPYLRLWLHERRRKGIESEWLFPSSRDASKPLNIDTLDDWAEEFTEFLHKDFYWHSMRHFFTTKLAREKVPVNVIKDIIQWESVEMVSLYTDITADENIGRYFSA